jgi:hypothetical protein
MLMYVIDMTHYVGVDELVGAEYNPVKRFVAHIGTIVGVGTANKPGEIIQSALACPRRPNRQACPGRLLVRRSEAPRQISWACPFCEEEQGVISNFEQTIWDLSPPLIIKGDEKAAVIGPDQYQRLLGLHALNPDAVRILHAITPIGNAVLVRAGEEDFERLIEAVAAEVKHEPGSKRRRGLDDVLAVLEAALVSDPRYA